MAVTIGRHPGSPGTSSLLNNIFTAGSQFMPAVISNVAGDQYFAAWADPSNSIQVNGRLVNAEQTPLTSEFTVNITANAGTGQFDPSVAGLTGGRFVVTYTDVAADPGGNIRARLYSADGTPLGNDFIIDTTTLNDFESSVSRLSGGGFVVTYTRSFVGNSDIRARVFDQDGNDLSGVVDVDNSAGNQGVSSVAGLNSGGFVAVWQDHGSDEVYFRRFQSNGTALDANRVLIDSTGTINGDIHVVALADGGFAVAYTDNGWGLDGTEITFRIFNADGTTRTSFIRANGPTAGNQNLPTITTMGDLIVVGWLDADSAIALVQTFDAQGNRLGINNQLSNQVVEYELAGLANGHLATVWSSSLSEGLGLGNSMRSMVAQFVRTHTDDAADDVIIGLDDFLPERLFGNGGNDILIGGAGGDTLSAGAGSDTASYETAPAGVAASLADSSINVGHAAGDTYFQLESLTGSAFNDMLIGNSIANALTGGADNDVLIGGPGPDTIDGGAGNDTAVYGGNRADYRISQLGLGDIQLIDMRPGSPDGTDIVRAVEHFAFLNGTVSAAAVLLPPSVHWSASTDIGTHPAGWRPSLTGDFNGDGTSDALWFNAATNNVDIWSIQNGQWAGSSDVGAHPAGWQPSAAGDFNGNGTDDVLWFNPTTNDVGIWTISNGPAGRKLACRTASARLYRRGRRRLQQRRHQRCALVQRRDGRHGSMDARQTANGAAASISVCSRSVGSRPASATSIATVRAMCSGTTRRPMIPKCG